MGRAKWVPTPEVVAAANLTDAINDRGASGYDEFYEWSRTDRAGFWGYTAARLGLKMHRKPSAVLGPASTAEQPVWFPDARLNIAESCFKADPEKAAIRYQRDGGLESITLGFCTVPSSITSNNTST